MKRFHYLRALLVFAFRENPLLWACLALAVISVLAEIAAMTSLLPLASIAAGQPVPENSYVVRAMRQVGLTVSHVNLLLVFVVLLSFRITTHFASQALTSWISRSLLAQLATRAFAGLVLRVPMREIERTSIGAYITLVGDESFRASTVVSHLNQAFSTGMLAALYFAAVVHYSPPAAIGVLAFMALSFAAMFRSFRVSHRLGERQVEQSKIAGSVFLDALNGLRSVRAFSAERYIAETYRTLMRQYTSTLFKVDLVSMTTRAGPALLLLAVLALAILWPGTARMLSVELPFLVTVVVFLMRFFPTVGQVLQIALRIAADAKAGRDVTHMVAFHDHVLPEEGVDPGRIDRIEASRLAFAHEPGRPVLEGVAFKLERGKSYALVGPSGSGKSTLLDLLLGFYPLDGGDLCINGTPISDVGEAHLRRRILLVSQNTSIFNDSVLANIRLGFDATRDEVRWACRIACADEFISTLPQGYDTVLAYQGGNLSGGQRQRIGIARAVLRRPDVLLLDESTSALDADTRARLVDNLLDQFADRILLFVTHDDYVCSRVSTVLDMSTLNRVPLGAAMRAAAA